MSQLLFSIIIPVYNTENYITTCLDSIFNQGFDISKYEVIIVDDGSTDFSSKVIKMYAQRFKNIVFIQKKNEGVSIARNIGIELARGKFLLFLDSDDFISEESLEKLNDILLYNKYLDLLIGRIIFINNEKQINEAYLFKQGFLEKDFSGIDLFINHGYCSGSSCGIAYNTDFLKKNNLRFANNIKNGEDTIFVAMCFLYAKKIQFIDEILYIANERIGSSSRNISFERVNHMINNLKEIRGIIQSNSWTSDQLSILNFEQYTVLSNMFNYFSTCFSLKYYLKIRKEIVRNGFRRINTGKIRKCKAKVIIYNFSIDLFMLLILFKRKIT